MENENLLLGKRYQCLKCGTEIICISTGKIPKCCDNFLTPKLTKVITCTEKGCKEEII
jgi:hypothetical protein